MAELTNVLTVSGVCKSYTDFALKDVTFSLPKGYIMGFIGPNGAGKTTTLKSILGVITPERGQVILFGNSNTGGGNNNSQIGVVMDNPLYVAEWTLREAELAISPFYANWDSGTFHSLLKRFNLDPRKKVKELSRGMKVKLQFSAALSHDASLLLLDEPTSGLDPAGRDEICNLLREFVASGERSVLFSTHITSDLEKAADFITFILNGEVVFTGTTDDLLCKYARVAGGELTPEQRRYVIGFRPHGVGFEGLILSENAGKMPASAVVEKASLEEIIIFAGKNGGENE
ncbi:ABC transporter ATP-binding protein [Clostridia bacterium]|nr:ABC transporter ATP-binding protein [Clostridia bacterium]